MTDTQRAAFEAACNALPEGVNWGDRLTPEIAQHITQAAQAANAGRGVHASDCAVHNEPAYPNGPCDCGLVATINAELVEALEACLAKGSRWHNCDPVVQQARAALSRAKEQKS